jgi:hypothetical protein
MKYNSTMQCTAEAYNNTSAAIIETPKPQMEHFLWVPHRYFQHLAYITSNGGRQKAVDLERDVKGSGSSILEILSR